jgi:hypothetical protein
MEAAMADDVVVLEDIPVLYVAGQKGRPIPEQAPPAFEALEAQLPTLMARRFYGAVLDGEYRACVAADDTLAALALPRWTPPGGRYVRRKIPDWENNRELIGPTCAALRSRPDSDPTRPLIEYYRSRAELRILAPVL